jgi:mRNA interferase RelE/StbE
MARYTVFFKPSADKALARLPKTVQKRIVAAVEELQENPRPMSCVKLEGEDDLWRIRVGDYRVIYTIRDDELTVLVLRVAHRKDIYRA